MPTTDDDDDDDDDDCGGGENKAQKPTLWLCLVDDLKALSYACQPHRKMYAKSQNQCYQLWDDWLTKKCY